MNSESTSTTRHSITDAKFRNGISYADHFAGAAVSAGDRFVKPRKNRAEGCPEAIALGFLKDLTDQIGACRNYARAIANGTGDRKWECWLGN